MGRCLLELAAKSEDFQIATGLVAPESVEAGLVIYAGDQPVRLTDKLDRECDVLIDVSLPEGTAAWVDFCERRDIPMVVGVTGHSEEQLARIREAAHQIPIVLASNFSVGINAMLGVLHTMMRQLGPGFDVEIVETHHRNKIDAPSGTALTLVEELRRARQSGDEERGSVVFGRQGKPGPRGDGEIAVHAVRMGEVVGQHEVFFSGPGETISIKHEAHSRNAFAAGALRAAKWVVEQGAGFYTMRDVLAPPSPPAAGARIPEPEI